jgi:hypothetical protein
MDARNGWARAPLWWHPLPVWGLWTAANSAAGAVGGVAIDAAGIVGAAAFGLAGAVAQWLVLAVYRLAPPSWVVATAVGSLLGWVAAFGAGGLVGTVGFLIVTPIGWAATALGLEPNAALLFLIVYRAAAGAGGAAAGGVVATFQRRLLHGQFGRADRWLLGSTIGVGAAALLAGTDLIFRVIPTQRPLSNEPGLLVFPSAAVAGAVFGAVYGAITGWALVRLLSRPPE